MACGACGSPTITSETVMVSSKVVKIKEKKALEILMTAKITTNVIPSENRENNSKY